MEQVKFTGSYLEQLEYVYSGGHSEHYSITAKGIVYYENEMDKPQREHEARNERRTDIAIGAGLAFAAQIVVEFIKYFFTPTPIKP